MTTLAYIGSQTLFQMGDGASPETFATVGEVTHIGPLSIKKDVIEVTHLLSVAREYVLGLSEGQEITLTCNNVPTDTKQSLLWTTANAISTSKNFKYVYPSTVAGGTKTYSFAALVLSASIGDTTPNGAVPVTFGLKITGAITGPS
jgi:hypothetical protein